MSNYENSETVMTVKECAEILHMNTQRLREAIENGSFEFGKCIKTSKSKLYKISRPAFMRWYKGESISNEAKQ